MIAKNGNRVREIQYVNMSLKIIAIILICIWTIATSHDFLKNIIYLPVFANYFALDDKRINGYHNKIGKNNNDQRFTFNSIRKQQLVGLKRMIFYAHILILICYLVDCVECFFKTSSLLHTNLHAKIMHVWIFNRNLIIMQNANNFRQP